MIIEAFLLAHAMFLKNNILLIIWTLAILLLTILPGGYFPKVPSFMDLFSPDKLVHFFIFGLLNIFAIFSFGKQYSFQVLRSYKTLFAMIYSISLGGITEILQGVMNWGRQASIYDFIANTIGCFIGLWIYYKLIKKKLKKNN